MYRKTYSILVELSICILKVEFFFLQINVIALHKDMINKAESIICRLKVEKVLFQINVYLGHKNV